MFLEVGKKYIISYTAGHPNTREDRTVYLEMTPVWIGLLSGRTTAIGIRSKVKNNNNNWQVADFYCPYTGLSHSSNPRDYTITEIKAEKPLDWV